MIKKVILILSLIALFSIVLGGCRITGFVTIPTKGTVYITVDENHSKLIEIIPLTYYIYMDNELVGTISSNETLVLHKVSLGNHTFEAWDTSGYYDGIVENRWIHSGINDVIIPVYLLD